MLSPSSAKVDGATKDNKTPTNAARKKIIEVLLSNCIEKFVDAWYESGKEDYFQALEWHTVKFFSNSLVGLGLFVLSGCVQPSGSQVTNTLPIPLTSQEIQSQLADTSLVGVDGDGRTVRIYFTPALDAIFIDVQSNNIVQFDFLKNGLVCSKHPDRRFCYRVFMTSDDILVTYANGKTQFKGKITEGNIFSL
ncbi:MAG: hypothetical protein ABJL72_01580 [Roseobacter sp.]